MMNLELRERKYEIVVQVDDLPETADSFMKYLNLLGMLRERTDSRAILQLTGRDDPQEILLSYGGEDYYMELNYPMDDFGWEHPLLLANDHVSFENTVSILWEILVKETETGDIQSVNKSFRNITEDIYKDS